MAETGGKSLDDSGEIQSAVVGILHSMRQAGAGEERLFRPSDLVNYMSSVCE